MQNRLRRAPAAGRQLFLIASIYLPSPAKLHSLEQPRPQVPQSEHPQLDFRFLLVQRCLAILPQEESRWDRNREPSAGTAVYRLLSRQSKPTVLVSLPQDPPIDRSSEAVYGKSCRLSAPWSLSISRVSK